MKMLFSIAWRNIWRHPGRSGVLIASIVAGMWAGIMVSSWANGLIEQRVNNVINEELTHAQIHHPEFLTEREPGMYIEPYDEIINFLDTDSRVQSYIRCSYHWSRQRDGEKNHNVSSKFNRG
jgi:ABC-type lipoprotein release transport system permease subunit